jgi:hypothetical protein
VPNKADHVAWAAEVVAVFQRHCRTVDEHAIADLICDLGHLAEERGFDFLNEVRRGIGHWYAEHHAHDREPYRARCRCRDLHHAEVAATRLADLLPIVRSAIYFPEFGFSNSIKSVAPALCPGFSYDGLHGVADGGAASGAFLQLASGALTVPGKADDLRNQLLAYCKRDTLAWSKCTGRCSA